MASHRILHILGTAGLSGTAICQIVERLAISLDREKYEIAACFLRCGEFVDQFSALGIKSTCLDWNGSGTNPLGAARFSRLLRSAKYDLIHQHTGGSFITKMNRIFTGAKIIHHVHSRATEKTGEVLSAVHIPKVDVTIANSKIIAESCDDPNAIVIYPGVDANEFCPDRHPGRRLVIGAACRLEPVKGISSLLQAIAIVASQDPTVRLEIAGEGSLRLELEGHAARLGLQENVSFLGWRRDLPLILGTWNVFIQPSLDEGFGVAVLEAMASGLPVIASDVGGLRELVRDGVTGFLTAPEVPAALASKIRLLLDNPALRAEMGAAASQRAKESFSLAAMVRKTTDVYDSLLGTILDSTMD